MKNRSLFVINNSDELAAFADRPETIDSFSVIVALGSSKLDETVEEKPRQQLNVLGSSFSPETRILRLAR